MTNNKEINMATHRSPLGKARSFVIICCIILVIGIVAYAYFTDSNDSVLEREKIEENLALYQNCDLGYTNVSSYLKKYGIGNINSYKLNSVESHLETDFYKPMPNEYETARIVTELYLEHYYDTIDKNDKSAVTDALINCLIASLEDPYAYYRNTEEFKEYLSSLKGNDSFVGIGVMVNAETLEVIMVYKDSGAEEAGIRRGDFIYAVNGRTIEEASADELINDIKGEAGTTVSLTVKRGDELIDVVATRRALSEQTVTYEIDEDGVGYIYVTQFLASTTQQFIDAVDYCTKNNAIAIVIDMRYNPGGLLSSVVSMIDYIVPDAPDRMITSYTQAQDKNVYYTNDGHGVSAPIAVICNGGTASAGELFTAAMRDFADSGAIQAVIVGENTYGKGVVQTSYTLYDASGITYTIGYYNPPCDVNFDGVGVAPDIEVAEADNTDAPFNTAKDEVMKLVYSNNGMACIYTPAA